MSLELLFAEIATLGADLNLVHEYQGNWRAQLSSTKSFPDHDFCQTMPNYGTTVEEALIRVIAAYNSGDFIDFMQLATESLKRNTIPPPTINLQALGLIKPFHRRI